MRRAALSMLAVTCLVARAAGQPVRPVPPAWDRAVTAFARALTAGDVDVLRPMLAAHVDVRSFGSDVQKDGERLVDATGGLKLIGVHAYLHPPTSMAADVAADVQARPEVPDEVKQDLTPQSDADRARAADAAAAWTATALEAGDATPVGVVLLWNPAAQGEARKPLFVLLRGRRADDGSFTVDRVVYGDPTK